MKAKPTHAADGKQIAATKRPRGRPPVHGPEVRGHICEQIAIGRSLVAICRDDPGMPRLTTVFDWLSREPEFAERYTRARECQADVLADQIVEISDEGRNDSYLDDNGNPVTNHDVIARSRLRVEARKWVAAKLKPKRYGDTIRQEVTGADGGPVQTEDVSTARLAALLAKAAGNVSPGK